MLIQILWFFTLFFGNIAHNNDIFHVDLILFENLSFWSIYDNFKQSSKSYANRYFIGSKMIDLMFYIVTILNNGSEGIVGSWFK